MGVGQLIRNVITTETDPTVASFTKSLTSNNTILTAVNAASGTISASVLPSYIDDVLNFANLAAFPVAGETSKIYVDETTNKVYRWSGSVYVEISSSATAGEALKLTNARTISTTGDATYSISFDGSANVSSAITLANTGVTAGTYNALSTQVRPFTVDAKGRITGVSEAINITPPWSAITGTPTTLSGYGITNALPLSGGTLTGALIATSFSGNGASLTTLNASNISTGTLNAARLPDSYLPLTGGTLTGPLWITGIRGTGAGIGMYEASPLGTVAGNTQLLSTKTGLVSNIASERTWIRRRVAGTDWQTALFHNGITVDIAFQTPGVDTRVWWERDIQTGSQSWGNGNTTFFSADSTRFNIPLTTPSTSTTTGAITAASLGITGAIFAQNLYTTGNVGIATVSPAEKLEVNGNIKLSSTAGSTSTPSYICLGNNYSDGATRDKLKIYLHSSGGEQYGFGIGAISDVQYHSNVYHDFYTANSLSVRINGSGNVGIGTTTPSQKLDVNGSAKATSFFVGTNQVVSSRKSGWSAPTGTATRTTFATSTVTLPELAGKVKALIDDLIAHGLIGA